VLWNFLSFFCWSLELEAGISPLLLEPCSAYQQSLVELIGFYEFQEKKWTLCLQ
jgi:hypothetical protein